MKTILITAGGTSEPIDNIRIITNTGTGALGSQIADAFAKDPQVGRIIYVHGRAAVLPKTEKAECVRITHTRELQETIRRVCAQAQPDAIIHSMAVSDYRVGAVIRAEDLEKVLFKAPDEDAEPSVYKDYAQYYMERMNAISRERVFGIADRLRPKKKEPEGIKTEPAEYLSRAAKFDLRDEFNKIPSSAGNPIIFLQPTPKIIPELRQLVPGAVIVGFKLLDDVAQEKLFAVAKRLMEKNDCDYVLANDYTTVQAGNHTGYLIARDGSFETFIGKPAIAEGIAAAVTKSWK